MSEVHPLFRMDDHGKSIPRGGATGHGRPVTTAKKLRGSLQVLQTKKINGAALTADLYTGVVTTAAGDIISITPTE